MKNVTKIPNVPLDGLIKLLSNLSGKYEFIDLIICPEDKTVIIEPVDLSGEGELTDENIYDLV